MQPQDVTPPPSQAGRYPFTDEHNPYMGALSAKLLHTSPKVMHDYLIRESRDDGRRSVEIWFKTAGCRYFLRGGCSMCNYGYSRKVTARSMVDSVAMALSKAAVRRQDKLVVSPSGSLLDDGEVPDEAFDGIMELVRRNPSHVFMCETQANYMTDDVVGKYRQALPERELFVVCAIESADPWLRRNVLNKDLPTLMFTNAIEIVHRHGVRMSTNILLGSPFLTEQEAIDDTVRSISWSLRRGVDECYVFPVHVKVGTLTHWLWRQGQYHPPSLWSLVEVLGRFPAHDLKRISTAWHKAYYIENADPTRKKRRMPYTCDACYRDVVALLDAYVATRDRTVITDLQRMSCSCKGIWLNELAADAPASLHDRVRQALEQAADEIMGHAWTARSRDTLEWLLAPRDSDKINLV